MSKTANQKSKLFYINHFLEKNSDEEHPVSVKEIIEYLNLNGISADRKTIYSDLEELRKVGIDVICVKNKSTGYFIGNRQFELPELKALVDSIQVSQFITPKKSKILLEKLTTLCSKYQKQQLLRTIYTFDDLKAGNEKIYQIIDTIQQAINISKKITFKCFEYNLNKEKQYRHNGKNYLVSPYAMTLNNNFYYMFAYDEIDNKEKIFRVDRMDAVTISEYDIEKEKIKPKEEMYDYLKKHFSMYGGKETLVTIEFDNSLINAVIDRFGKNVSIQKIDDKSFKVTSRVVVSPQFFGWLLGFGNLAKLTGPKEIQDELKEYINLSLERYVK